MTRKITDKQHNILRLVRLIHQRDPVSQKELSEISGLQPSTISVLLKELKRKKLVIVAGKGDSNVQGGKKADLLQLNGNQGVFTGCYIKKKTISLCTINLEGVIKNYSEIAIKEFSPDWISNVIAETVQHDQSIYPMYKGIGIAVQSAVTPEGNIIMSPGFNIEIPNLKRIIASIAKNTFVVVENDANCSAYHFHNDYQGKYANLTAILFYFDPLSMGAGIVLNGTLYRGVNGSAGEIWRAQNTILEQILRDHHNDIEQVKNSADFPVFVEQIRQYLMFIAMLLDVNALVLCGDLSKLGGDALGALRESVAAGCNRVAVEIADSFDAPIIGAAEIATELFLRKEIQKIG